MVLINFQELRDCRTVFQLAEVLEIDVRTLLFFAYNNVALYTIYEIKKKSGGKRIISAPIDALKTVSRKLATHLNEIYEEALPKSSHGFINQRGIITNASSHLSKKYILNIDLENFFQTINTGRIMGLFRKYPFLFNRKMASVLAGIVTHNNSLPQGSPCSPVLSNMICLKLDRDLTKLAESMGWTYTRYADDITFSTNRLSDDLASTDQGALHPGEKIKAIIKRNGFSINNKKTRLAEPGKSKWVTGVKVNKDPNVSRKLIRQVRAFIHFLEKQKSLENDTEIFLKKNRKLINIVRGKISHIGNVKLRTNITYIKLYNRLCEIENKQHKRIPESIKEYAMEKTLVIKTSKGFGSGFFISKNLIVTAAHVLHENDRSVEFTTRSRRLPAEFKSASVLDLDQDNDLAVLYTVTSEFSESIFETDFRSRNLDHNTDYISLGYGGFRSHKTFWSDVCAVDQRIVQVEDVADKLQYRVNTAMWSGMSGGPVILKQTGSVVGYITQGAPSQESSADIKGFIFKPLSNIPLEFRNNGKEESDSNFLAF